jgi:Mg-chelatase subunit ChlD
MKKKCFKMIVFVIIVCTFISAFLLYPQQSKFAKLFKVKIDTQVYQVGQISQLGLSGEVVLDDKRNFVTDKDILKKAFQVGELCGWRPPQENRFYGFISKVDSFKQKYKQCLDVIPLAESLEWYAYDMGPRILVELLKIYFSGGTLIIAKLGRISKAGLTTKEFIKQLLKEAAKQGVKVLKATKPILIKSIKDMIKKPRPYVVEIIKMDLGMVINSLDETKQKAESLKNKEILDYKEVIELHESFWDNAINGNAGLAMYEQVSGSLGDDILNALKNMLKQLVDELEVAQEILGFESFLEKLDNVLRTSNVTLIAIKEAQVMIEQKNSEAVSLSLRLNDRIELSVRIANQLSKSPTVLTTTGTALSLIIDSSGSMSSNDPQNARIFAGELVLDQAKNDWEIGIVDFDTSSQLLGSGPPQNKNLKESLKRIGASGGTNIQSGLKNSFDFLEKTIGMKKGAILLTDGDHNTPSGNFDYNQYVNIYIQKGWPVYTLGLTGNANAVLLSKIAAMTGGMYFKANTYQDMVGIIDIILSQFKDETIVCHYKKNIKQGEEKDFSFPLDDSVTLLSMTGTYPGSKIDFSLIDPQNRELSRTDPSGGVRVTQGKIYKIIKVKKPMPGQWKARVKGLQVHRQTEPFEVKISADTPIKVETKEAKPVYMPFEPIKFKVNVAGNVNDQSLSYAVNVTPPEGKPENIPLRKSSQVVYPKTQKPGVYYFKVKVTGEKNDKEPFMREGLKHIVVSDSGKEYGVGQIIKLMGGYFEINLGKEIGLKIGKKIYVFSISRGVKKKIAEGFVTSVSQGKSMVQLTESWALETPKKGNRVEIDRKEF